MKFVVLKTFFKKNDKKHVLKKRQIFWLFLDVDKQARGCIHRHDDEAVFVCLKWRTYVCACVSEVKTDQLASSSVTSLHPTWDAGRGGARQ